MDEERRGPVSRLGRTGGRSLRLQRNGQRQRAGRRRHPRRLALAEYLTSKRNAENLREARHGCRCDLWVRPSPRETWAIELKQMLPEGRAPPTARQIDSRMAAAKKDATCLSWREADVRLAGVVISTWYLNSRCRADAEPILRKAADTVDAAALFGSTRSLTCVLMNRVGG